MKDTYPVIRSIFADAWNFCWELEIQKMKELTNSSHPWKYSDMARSREVILCRLRIGHTRLTHGFLMNRDPQPFCEDCLVPLTVKYFMIECPSLSDKRDQHFLNCRDSNGSYSLSNILGPRFVEENLI